MEGPRGWRRCEPNAWSTSRAWSVGGSTAPAPEFPLAFIRSAETLLSITQTVIVLDRADNTIHTAVRDLEAALERGFPAVWNRLEQPYSGPLQVDERGNHFLDLSHPRTDSISV